jgi:hypothetical protein
MRIAGSPMAALRAAAIVKVNERYNALATQNVHRDAAHAHKRAVAAAVIAGAEAPAEFSAEAALRNVSPLALAELIASKPNDAAQRELARQTELLTIAGALRPDQLPQG